MLQKNLKYLNNCDLINKFNLKSAHNSIKLCAIKLSFPLQKFLNTFEIKNKKIIYLAKIPYLVLFLYFSKLLKIKYNSFHQEYTLEIRITNCLEMYKLLFLIFIENQNCFYNFNGLPIGMQYKTNNIISYTYKLPTLLLNGLDELIKTFFSNLNLKKFYMYVNFFFKYPKTINASNILLKNYPFFSSMNFYTPI